MLPPEVGEDCILDAVVIVQRPDSITRKSASCTKSESPNGKGSMSVKDGGRGRHKCRCRHVDIVRQRHNATQTPGPILSCSQISSCHGHSATIECCGKKNAKSCCGLVNGDLKSGEIACHCHITHHCHHYSPGGGGHGDGDIRRKKHCEHRGRNGRTFHRHRHEHQQHHHHHYRHLQPEFHYRNINNVSQLPGYNSKSSFDSSDDIQQSGLNSQQERLQEIAIEIDAATMSEDNTSTATSNFAYKMAMGNIAAPIIMAPLHDNDEDCKKQRRTQSHVRCDSMNSESTAETDELSRRNFKERINERATNSSLITGQHKNAHHTFWGSRDINDRVNTYSRTEPKTDRRIEDNIKHVACCNDSLCCGTSGEGTEQNVAHNECVKIRRKLFKASTSDDCCSTCSHCSNCSCQNADGTSCSSIDDLDADDNDEEQRMAPHELVVAAECHRCNLHRRSTTSSTGEEAEEDADTDDKLTARSAKPSSHLQKHLQDNNTTDSSAHTSRRSSASYCSCHSSTCCCCECNCVGDDDCETATTGQMHTARETSCTALTSAATDFDADHSSTLTPLTNASSVVSTPGAEEADVTLRSFNNTLADDVCSSLSQSAEYFSLSSSNHQSQMSPADTPTRRPRKVHGGGGEIETAETPLKSIMHDSGEASATTSSRKPCKHYIKRHRHKRAGSPLDCYL